MKKKIFINTAYFLVTIILQHCWGIDSSCTGIEATLPRVRIVRSGNGIIDEVKAAIFVRKDLCPTGTFFRLPSSLDSEGSMPEVNTSMYPIRLNIDDIPQSILETWSPDLMTSFRGMAAGSTFEHYSFLVHGIDERRYEARSNFFETLGEYKITSQDDFFRYYPYSLFLRTVVSTSLVSPSQSHTISDKGFIFSVSSQNYIAASLGDMSSPMSSAFYPSDRLSSGLQSFRDIAFDRHQLTEKEWYIAPVTAESTSFHYLGGGYLNAGWNEVLVTPVVEQQGHKWIAITGIYISGSLSKISSRPDLQALCALAEQFDLPIVHIDNQYEGPTYPARAEGETLQATLKGGNIAPEYFEQLNILALSGDISARHKLQTHASHLTDQPWGSQEDDTRIRLILQNYRLSVS